MIVELISKYLENNKRLVVPNLGAFIVKEAGRVVLFSNLIKGDDGVLRSLLVDCGCLFRLTRTRPTFRAMRKANITT